MATMVVSLLGNALIVEKLNLLVPSVTGTWEMALFEINLGVKNVEVETDM